MSRRGRAAVFGLLALAAAIAAGVVANGYGSSIARGFGALRPVVVVSSELPAGEVIDPHAADRSLEIRRVPIRFVPPGTLSAPESALGLAPDADIPPGAYLQAQGLSPPDSGEARDALGGGRQPVEIVVSGAGSIPGPGGRVDVVVTTEPTGPGPGKTYVEARAVPLLAIAGNKATLGLHRAQALELIAAENFARQITLLPR